MKKLASLLFVGAFAVPALAEPPVAQPKQPLLEQRVLQEGLLDSNAGLMRNLGTLPKQSFVRADHGAHAVWFEALAAKPAPSQPVAWLSAVQPSASVSFLANDRRQVLDLLNDLPRVDARGTVDKLMQSSPHGDAIKAIRP